MSLIFFAVPPHKSPSQLAPTLPTWWHKYHPPIVFPPSKRKEVSALVSAASLEAKLPATAPMSPNFRAMLVGIVLGDGGLRRQGKTDRTRACLRVKTGTGKLALAEYIQTELSTHFHTRLSIYEVVQIAPVTGAIGDLQTHEVSTRVHPILTSLFESFYQIKGVTPAGNPQSHKILPRDLILEVMGPVFLAWWIIGDGCRSKDSGYMQIYTGLIPFEDATFICEVLNKEFPGLDASPRVTRARPEKNLRAHTNIFIPARGLRMLAPLLEPHTHPSMMYRLKAQEE